MRKKKMMRRRKTLMKEIGFLPWPSGPLERQGPKYTSWFLSADGTEESMYQRKRYVQKKREGDKKVSIKKHKFTSSSTRGLAS
jgi:hypothetical protein